MKRIAFFLSFLMLLGTLASAQSNKRTSAYMYNNNGLLDKAKEAIDEATVHEKTMNDPKTWLYRGMIYYNIAVSQLPAYQDLDPNAAMVAYEAFLKSKELDVKEKYDDDRSIYMGNLISVFYGEGGDAFQNGEYDKAIDAFKIAYNIADSEGKMDTIAAFNIGMAGVLSNQPDVASEYLQKCVEADFNEPRVYMFYNRSVKQLGDTARALDIIRQGRERFPGELSLLLEEAQLYLERGENEKLQQSLLAAIEQDPNNANLYFLLGKTYDDGGEKVIAEEYYLKAAEVNPQFFEAYYNIGAIYVNAAAEYQVQANDLPLDATEKYEELTKEANKNLEKAVPYLEKSLELKPDDVPTITALKEAYARLKMTDKLQQLNEK
jgi:tetratricopeptide (TPR) repeat protein